MSQEEAQKGEAKEKTNIGKYGPDISVLLVVDTSTQIFASRMCTTHDKGNIIYSTSSYLLFIEGMGSGRSIYG